MLFYSVVPDTESMYVKYKVHDIIRFPSLQRFTNQLSATVFGVVSCLCYAVDARGRWSVTNSKLPQRIKFLYEPYLYLCKLLWN